ncbi:unnamed protein product [Alopecurus aequalis]
MAPQSATSRTFLAACFFLLQVFFLSHHIPAAATLPPLSFSFDFSNTSKYRLEDLQFEGDAAVNGDLVDLTSTSNTTYYRSGRMSYKNPVVLYDNNTGEVASFTTTFTFAINLWPNSTRKGDGLTFFLSAYPSKLPLASYSNLLGLTNSSESEATGAARFVAVEFDTYVNPWDPTGSTDHMGIDINSITSNITTMLPSYSLNGTMTATITFDNTSRTLEATLHFDGNRSLASASVKMQLPGQLDALLPPVVAVGFSAATGGNNELHHIYSWSFNSGMADRETPTGFNRVNPEQHKVLGVKGRQGRALAGGLGTLSSLALMSAIWSMLSWYKLKCKRDYFGKGTRLKRLEYNDLSIATGRFSEKNKIGEGDFGVVYRGSLRKKEVAVKKIVKDSQGYFKDFLAELGTISETGHMNVVSLEGWCCSLSNFIFWCLDRQNVQLFIVYELVPNGNLHEHLYEKKEALSWEKRYNIVKGLCAALHYLHHQCAKCILHRDIKPGNILLDDDFNAKLGDFGLSRSAGHIDATSVGAEIAAGTRLYMDLLGQKDPKANFRRSSDVYSFGIVLLEIAHGKNDSGHVREVHTDQPDTFVQDIADEKLAGKFDKAQMKRVIVLGLRCCDPVASKRPSMVGAMQFLENGGELPAAAIHPDEPTESAASPWQTRSPEPLLASFSLQV